MPSLSRRPARGEIWLADLSPSTGHEQAGPPRPVLIVSGSAMNLAPYRLSLVVPLSTKIKRLPGHLFLAAAVSGLRADSEILCEHLRAVSHQRFRSESPLTQLGPAIVQQVLEQIALLTR